MRMSLRGRASSVLRHSNTPAVRRGLAFGGAFALALARALDGKKHRQRPSAPARVGWARWKHILYRTYEEIGDDRLLALAAGVVFYGLLAIFPAVTALVSSYALFAEPSTIGKHLAMIGSVMPESAYSVVNDQVLRIV